MAEKNNNKEELNGDIPVSLLNQLNEYTAGGFILFYFNSKTGFPEKAMTFDSPAHSIAMQKHVADWSEALHNLNVDAEMEILTSHCERPEEDDEEGE